MNDFKRQLLNKLFRPEKLIHMDLQTDIHYTIIVPAVQCLWKVT